MLRRILRNVASNWAGGTVSAIIAFFLTPYVIAQLSSAQHGNQAYGVWTFIVAATAYFGLVDAGIYQGVLQYFTRRYSRSEVEAFNQVLASGFTMLVVLSLICLGIVGVVAVFSPNFVDSFGISVREIRIAFLLTATGVLVRVSLAVYNAVIVGSSSFHVLNGILVAEKLIHAIATVVVLEQGWGLVGLAAASLLGAIFEALAKAYSAYSLVPEISVRMGDFSRSVGRTILGYGKWMLGRRISFMYLANVDLILVPMLFGAEAAAVYGLAITFIAYAQIPLRGVAFSLTPLAISADARDSMKQLQTILVAGSRLGLTVAGLFFVGFLFLGESFILQWLDDPSFLGESKSISAATVLSIAAIDRVVLQGLIGPPQVLIGMRRVRLLGLVNIVQGLSGLVLAFVSGKLLGLIAVPIAMAVAAAAGNTVTATYACRLAGVPLKRFASEAVLRPFLVMALTGIACIFITEAVQSRGWMSLVFQIFLISMVYGVLALLVCITGEERQTMVARFLRSWKETASEDDTD